MKILILGANKEHNLEYLYAKHLNSFENVSCKILPSYNDFADIIQKSILNKIINRINVNFLLQEVNKKIIHHAQQNPVDIIWVFKGMEVLPTTIETLKNMGCTLINYNPDHPFIFSGIGSGNKNVTNSFSLFDYHITYNTSLKEKIEQNFGIPTFLLPFGFELEDELYKNVSKLEEINKVCFIGNPDNTRVQFINYLVEHNVHLDLYGHGWESKIKNKEKCQIFDAVYHDEYWKIIRRYRVQLNIFRQHNTGSHNMRTFEIPAVGGIQLAPDTVENRLFFEDQKDIFLYTSMQDCVSKIIELQNLNDNQVEAIRKAARQKSISSNYDYANRAAQLVEIFKTIVK